ncbi:vacuolar protein sorting-associated protein 53, partial [Tremellales sp. Uapishka_1]
MALSRVPTPLPASADQATSSNGTNQKVMDRLARDFPDAESLSRHHQILARLQLEILDTKDEISRLKAELRRDQDPDKMSRIQRMIGQLMLQINVIREKAAEAEAIVKAITSDIQRLDIAKRNLTGAMQNLERWGMLTARDDTDQKIQGHGAGALCRLNLAVTHLLGPLKPLGTIVTVAELFAAAQEDRTKVQEKVGEEMEALSKQTGRLERHRGSMLSDRRSGRGLQIQLAEYRRIFRSTDEAGQLDNVPRRYAWFRRVLKSHDDDHAHLFPESWQVTRLLVASFSESTRMDLANVLGKATPNVNVLLDALQSTKDFESAFTKRFNMPFEDITAGVSQVSTAKWTISSIFDSYLGIYVDAQDRSSMEGAMQQDTDSPVPIVLPSSTELFYFYGQTLEQCGKYTTEEPMEKLGKLFAKWLRIYSADRFYESAVYRGQAEPTRDQERVHDPEHRRILSKHLAPKRLKDKISESFREDVSFQAERDTFSSVMSSCIATILRELEATCEPAFAAILKTPWMHLENVSGRSAYVVDLVASIKQVAEVVRERVESKKYIRNFADKAVGLVITRFTQSVVKSRPLKKIGAEQILLDVQAVKACLLDLPEPHPDNSTNAYTKYVTKNTGQLETMLKVILAPDDPPEGFVQNYCLLIGDRSFSNFQKVLDLKGTPRSDQQKLLDIFLSVTSTKDDLSDTSFLTQLDMDPTAEKSVSSPMFSPTTSSSVLPNLLRSASGEGMERSDTNKTFGDFRRLVSFARGRE